MSSNDTPDSNVPFDTSTPAEQKKETIVVGIGASAGGLSSLKALFKDVPSDSGLVFVVVVHLSPEHKSHLADLLQPYVHIPVQQVTETVPLLPNRMYVIPPGYNLSAIDTHLRLSDLEERRQERAPIDHFFRTLAKVHDGHSIGVILSGTGSDGTLGIRDIKARGGVTIVQDPNEAEYDGMPQSAIATGMADLVLPVAEIARAILQFARTAPKIALPSDGEKINGDERMLLQKIFAQLRVRTGRDFSRYKPATLMRRISRRMQLSQIEDFAQYVELMKQQPEEGRALSDDLLITVTNFFRDADVFEKLEKEIIPALFDSVEGSDPIRVWSVGCATGEEPYSMAMLLLEENARRDLAVPIQIFASDLHERSLMKAREGVYPGDIETDIRPDRLKRFFQKQNGVYRVRKEVRDVVVFAPHNLLADPPFSRINLITCRNLLIYLQREVQRDIVELFHYAIVPSGFLILGTSEAIETPELFSTEDKNLRIYRKRNVPGPEPRLPVFPITRGHVERETKGPPHPDQIVAFDSLHQSMVARAARPSVLVGPDDKVVHFSDNVGVYFLQAAGQPTSNIFKLARTELQIELRSLIHEARTQRKTVRSRPVSVEIDGQVKAVTISVHPSLELSHDGFLLVTFEDSTVPPSVTAGGNAEGQGEPHLAKIDELQQELDLSRQRLQAILEEYETSREEMKAANEELQSTNEELRSTLEELETSKEELQSMNEELQTVNQENRHKVDELALLSGDLQNLLTSTEIATLFLDRELRILRFTPKVGDLFNVRTMDRGRPISDLTHRLGYDQMRLDAESVLERLIPIDRELRDESGRWYLTRVLPYRSGEDRIDGIVITFVDITELKQSEEALRHAQDQLASELQIMVLLNQLVEKLVASPDMKSALDQVLTAAIEIAGADKGNVQLLDPATGVLKIVAQHGFQKEFLDYFRTVGLDDNTSCSLALRNSERVTIEDVESDERYAQYREIAAASGYRAVDSTPLLSFKRRMLGVLSVHWKHPHRPSERDLRTLDLYCRQAAEFIERTRSEDALRDQDEKRNEFLAILAHELRNPLAPIRNAAEVLKRSGDNVDLQQRAIDTIDRQVQQMAHLVGDLLEVSRISLGKIKLHRQKVLLSSCLQQAIDGVQPQCDSRSQRLRLEIRNDLYLDADPVRLNQIVGNLLNNASKFTKRGGQIDLTAERSGRFAVIRARDTGKGIQSDQLSRIFEMFAQVETSIEKSESGLGIGLTLAKHLVELHGGTIHAHSEGPGLGSTFEVRLPALDDVPVPDPPPPIDDSEVRTRRRILIVDDNRDAAESLAMLLGMAGHDVTTASDGYLALESAKRTEPDIIIMDLGMPGLNGYDTAQRMRKEIPHRKFFIIALTGWNQPDDIRRARQSGFNAHMVKPADFKELERILTSLQ